MKSSKNEILGSLKELQEKGVQVKFHESLIQRYSGNGYTLPGSGVFVGGTHLLAPKELTVNIYINSSEEEIMNQIINAKDAIKRYEEIAQVSAIVEFLKEEFK